MKNQLMWRFIFLLIGMGTPIMAFLLSQKLAKRSVVFGQYCDSTKINMSLIDINDERLSYLYDLFDPTMNPIEYDNLIKYMCAQNNAESKNTRIKIEDLYIQKYIKTNNLYPKSNIGILQPFQTKYNSSVVLSVYMLTMIICICVFYFACTEARKKLNHGIEPEKLNDLSHIDTLLTLFLTTILITILFSIFLPNFKVLEFRLVIGLWTVCLGFFTFIAKEASDRLLFSKK